MKIHTKSAKGGFAHYFDKSRQEWKSRESVKVDSKQFDRPSILSSLIPIYGSDEKVNESDRFTLGKPVAIRGKDAVYENSAAKMIVTPYPENADSPDALIISIAAPTLKFIVSDDNFYVDEEERVIGVTVKVSDAVALPEKVKVLCFI